MFINAHTHIFNVQSALTAEMERMILSRLEGHKFEGVLRGPLSRLMTKIRKKSGSIGTRGFSSRSPYQEFVVDFLEQDEMVELLAKEGLKKSAARRALSEAAVAAEDADSNSEVEASTAFVRGFFKSAAEKDVETSSLSDYLDFVRIAFMDSMDDVGDHALRGIKNEGAIVALPMDIIDSDATVSDLKLYEKQMDQTVRQAIRNPGRVFPFFMVNTNRSGHFAMMKKYIESGSCVGIKLYPSLGYKTQSAAMQKVVDYAEANEVPMLIHTNGGGFKKSEQWAQEANPALWRDYLRKTKRFKICFAHFGGDEHLAEPDTDYGKQSDQWCKEILSLMDQYPGRVYTDISFHTVGMIKGKNGAGKSYRDAYFSFLKSAMSPTVRSKQIMFGSDYFLVRQRASDRSIYDWFNKFGPKILDDTKWRRLTSENALDFLGVELSAGGKRIGGVTSTMQAHVKWLLEYGGVRSRVPIAGEQLIRGLERATFSASRSVPVPEPMMRLSDGWHPEYNALHRALATFFITGKRVDKLTENYYKILKALPYDQRLKTLGGMTRKDISLPDNKLGPILRSVMPHLKAAGFDLSDDARKELKTKDLIEKVIKPWFDAKPDHAYPWSCVILGKPESEDPFVKAGLDDFLTLV